MALHVETRKLTVAGFHRMEFDDTDTHLYELLDGELVKKEASTPEHQLLVRDLAFAMHSFAKQQQLGEVIFAPVDVFLDEYNSPQPDLVYVDKTKADLITNDDIVGVPTLVVEVISPSPVY